ncbi:hypothetical protein [Streptomyces sp. NPDC007100]|uniref:hypothetical protein n=1 Tax=Streptomyces sp. NPDC007100 TaxID=3155602 RepID=UPI0033E5D157
MPAAPSDDLKKALDGRVTLPVQPSDAPYTCAEIRGSAVPVTKGGRERAAVS